MMSSSIQPSNAEAKTWDSFSKFPKPQPLNIHQFGNGATYSASVSTHTVVLTYYLLF